jgi:hypothetical protein
VSAGEDATGAEAAAGRSGPASEGSSTSAGRAKSKPGSFDRIRRDSVPEATSGRDPLGKQALFSGAEQPPSLGSVALDCPLCHRRTIVSVVRLAQMSLPGVHVPVPRRGYRAWVKCPACESRTWVRVTLGR